WELPVKGRRRNVGEVRIHVVEEDKERSASLPAGLLREQLPVHMFAPAEEPIELSGIGDQTQAPSEFSSQHIPAFVGENRNRSGYMERLESALQSEIGA